MGLASFSVNYIAVVVSAIGGMIVGALWYSPLIFGKQWVALMGLGKKDMQKAKQKGMGKSYLTAFIGLLVLSYVLAMFVKALGAVSFVDGIMVGFWIWLGFGATVMLNSVLWEGKSFNLYLINASHYLVVLALMGGILGAWG